MSTIVTRAGKGTPLSNTEMDDNFINLNSDKYESGDNINVGTIDATGKTTLGGDIVSSISIAVTAAGSTQGTATALSKTFSVITAATGTGVLLPTPEAGLEYTIINAHTSVIKLYPNTSGTINSGTTNTPIDITPGATIKVVGTSNTNWQTLVETVIYDSSGNRLN